MTIKLAISFVNKVSCCLVAQLCRLVLHSHYDGNIIFEITSTRPIQSTDHDYQVLLYTAFLLY